MKGDFSRDTFDPKKHYSGVRLQQGRVQMDADWNEQIDITAHRDRTEATDTIGGCGAPVNKAGFQIGAGAPTAGDLTIGAGRYYADGLLCENEAAVTLSSQPDLPGLPPIAADGTYVVYLDVWHRHLTALEDTSIREVALGGPDTATRTKTVWQVKYARAGDVGMAATCTTVADPWPAASTGTMRARATAAADSGSPCVIPPSAGFRRLENQLYRVEIQKPGAVGVATFKWSRDNGSILTEWLDQTTNVLKVTSIGRDGVLNFAPGQFIELIDDARELSGQPGTLVRVDKAEGQLLTITGTVDRNNFKGNPKIRRWDSPDPGETVVTRPGVNDGFLPLESGVEVRFEDGQYATGDYWLIPARTNTANIEWPPDAANPLLGAAQPPRGIRHHFCRLALVRFAANAVTGIEDCRQLFLPLTGINTFFYLGGDGQEVMPDPSALVPLAQPLRAGVSNGLKDAKVRFEIKQGAGQLHGKSGPVDIDVKDGVAECDWALDSNTPVQVVEANLLDTGGKTVHLPIRYTANLSMAGQVSYDPKKCSNLAGVKTVQEALDRLCQDPGIHVRRLLLRNNERFGNDLDVTTEALSKGIVIEFDQEIEPLTAVRPTCFVTVEAPFSTPRFATTVPVVSPASAHTSFILTADVRAEGPTIVWIPTREAVEFLSHPEVLRNVGETKTLAHLTLKGNFISAKGRPDLVLDGEVFGRPEGARVAEVLPSGDRRRGGDLEIWFWILPPSDIFATFTVVPAALSSSTVSRGKGTITLSSAATGANGVTVALTSTAPPNLIAMPASVLVAPGSLVANFDVAVINRVLTPTPVTITASAQGAAISTVVTVIPAG